MSESKDLRIRLAAAQAQHHHWDYAGTLAWCVCGENFRLYHVGWEAAVQQWAQHVADAVTRELREWLADE